MRHSASFAGMAIHLGKHIEAVREQAGMPKSTLAERIGRSRQNLDDILKAPGCDTVLLRKISTVLKHDFFRQLSEDFSPPTSPTAAEPMVQYQRLPARQPMRIVIEVDPGDAEAKGEAQVLAGKIAQAVQSRAKKSK